MPTSNLWIYRRSSSPPEHPSRYVHIAFFLPGETAVRSPADALGFAAEYAVLRLDFNAEAAIETLFYRWMPSFDSSANRDLEGRNIRRSKFSYSNQMPSMATVHPAVEHGSKRSRIGAPRQ
jgi:hypothetical protein